MEVLNMVDESKQIIKMIVIRINKFRTRDVTRYVFYKYYRGEDKLEKGKRTVKKKSGDYEEIIISNKL